ncbi:MAG: hypothetical protein AB8F34_03700 [Akkermansiaceae bacterium]
MDTNQDTYRTRMGLFGDLPTRAMTWALQKSPNMPLWVEASLLHFFTFIVFMLARQQRESIRRNLCVIHDDLAFFEGYVWTFLVFRNFGWTYIDSLRTRLGQDVVSWSIEGEEHFSKMRENTGAAILFTTHTGNYDLAAALFAPEFRRTLHTVRMPERTQSLQAIREKELTEDTTSQDHLKVHYNKPDNLLGIELANILSQGELVAVQCDRVIGQVVELAIPLANRAETLRVPKGPLTLACFAKCPCYPLYVVRERFRHYRIIFRPAIVPDTENRRVREMDYGRAWSKELMGFLERHSRQWFVFEDAFNLTDIK